MANLKSFYFPGQVIEKQELKDLDSGKSVINLIIGNAEEIVKGFVQSFDKRIVIFSKKAEEADAKINEGDYVVFSECKRNPRIFTTDAGTRVETIDIVAAQFAVIPAAKFASVAEALKKTGNVPSMNDLSFTEEDSKVWEANMAKAAVLGSDSNTSSDKAAAEL